METDVLKRQNSEEVFAEHKDEDENEHQNKEEQKEDEPITSSLEFDKNQLFFHSFFF